MKNYHVFIFTILLMILFGYFTNSYNYNPWGLFFIYILFFSFIVYLYKKKLYFKLPVIVIVISFLFLIIAKYLKSGKIELDLPTFSFLFSIILFFLLSILFSKKKSFRIIYLVFFIIINYFFCFYIYFLSTNYISFGTYNGSFNYTISKQINVKDEAGFLKSLRNDKTYVIDMWNKGCGICFKKFPKFENLKNKYAKVKNVDFFAINIYNSEKEIKPSQELFNKKNLSFQTYYVYQNDAFDLKTDFFPTTLVIKNGKIIFKGNVETLDALHFLYLK
jgi:thiol-disulfide isomerase/thioredoxin